MQNFVRKFWAEEDGQGMAEYGLILALIAVGCIGTLQLLGPAIAAQFTAVTDAL